MTNTLLTSSYVFDQELCIWARPDFAGINYTDGDKTEQRISDAINQASDVSVLSTELHQYCTDWPSLYHLSGTRANIMRPFEGMLKGDVLEIGAGCGAITRYLGECGANVLALEGSPRRAAITRSRTRELENVTVLAEKFDQFQCDRQFDVITLIGVLEYANLFTTGENPPLVMLERVRALLKPDGKLIIAIENQLGLKYFAGAPEDHLGQPMVGIEGRYRKDQPQTFGRKVLAGLLEQAGFAAPEFLAPFPDYKLPVSIITEEGFSNKNFDAAAFAWQSARRDPQLPTYCNFSLELAWPEVFQNELGLDVANSFLIIASPNSKQLIATGELAYHYSVDRIPEYCKETVFSRSDGGDIRVGYRRLGAPNENADKTNDPLIRFAFPDSDKYVFGSPLSLELIGIVTKDGWSFNQVARFVWRYLTIAETFSRSANMQVSMASPYTELPGEYFDVVPQNIIICEDGSASLIDKEWQLTFPIEVAHLLFRSLLLLVNSTTRFGRPVSQAVMTRYQFIDGVFTAAGLSVQEGDYARYISLEADIQQSVTGRAAKNFLAWGKNQPLPILNLSQAVAERDGQIASLSQAVPERNGQIARLNQILVERDEQIANLNEALVERERRGADQLAIMVGRLAQETSERAEEIASLNSIVTERDGQIASLSQAVAERDGQQIASLNQAVAERDGQIASLNQAVTERNTYIRTLVSSKSWRITKPVRWAGRIMRGDFVAAMDPVKKALRLRAKVEPSSSGAGDDNSAPACGSFVIPSPIKPTHPVAVILPVYRGIEMTKRCILAAMPGMLAVPDSRLIAINDASPDKGMQEMLEQLATQWPNVFVVLKNERNLGFVGTVNRGFAYFPQHDAVLLNSDVIVPQDWLSRLIDEAYSRADIGTVTPFSNNATICSFPHFLQENIPPFNLDVDSVDAVFRHAKLPCIEAPTGVGFCMYIRRACLEVTGYLNQEKFGRGYGEENDLCQRALKSGWHNIISPNLYAYHEGGVSFSSDKQALVDRAMRVIDELHPGYHASVQSFIAQDPLKLARVERHIQLLAATAVPKVLHISHAIGGGVGQHIEELAHYFSQQAAHILLAPHGEDGAVSISLGVGGHADKLVFQVPKEYGVMVDLLKSAGISAVHIHHTTGLESKILDLPHDLGVAYLLTAHDYYWLNGNPTLTDENGQYPGFYSDVQRNPLYPLPQGQTPKIWQARFRPLIEDASCVIFPSNATKKLFDHVYEPANAVVAPHIEAQSVSREPSPFTEKEIYTIGILGAIGREKGADLLERIAECAKNLNVPLEFKLIGYAYRSLKEVETTGPYKPRDLNGLIQKHGLNIVFFPAQCPETYSYTLSHALDSKLPIIAPNIGAFPERLSGRANTLLFNHLTPANELLSQINVFIEALSAGESITSPVFEGDQSRPDFYACNYLSIVSRSLRTIDNEKLLIPQLDASQIISGSRNNRSIWRNFLTKALWSLYMNPAMQWVNYVIPYTARRFVKRSLNRRPIHDIINLK